MSDPFRALREHEPLVLNRNVLSPSYVPTEIPGRELDTARLAGALYPILQGGTPPSISITGSAGAGKTTLARFVLQKLRENADQAAIPLVLAHVDGRLVNTQYRLLALLANHFTTGWAERVPATGWPTTEVRRVLQERLAAHEGRIVILVDHADELLATAGEASIDDLANLERVSLVSTLRDERALRRTSRSAHAALCAQVLHLDAYTEAQVVGILRERAALGLRHVPDAEVLQRIARGARAQAGEALHVLLEASDLAGWNGGSEVTLDHAEEARRRVERQRAHDALTTASDQERAVLRAVSAAIASQHEDVVSTGDVYRAYVFIAREAGFEILSMRRVTDLIDHLAARGLVLARVKSRGRYGRTKEIGLLVTPDALRTGPADA